MRYLFILFLFGNEVMMAYSIEGMSRLTKQTIRATSGTLSQNYPDIAFHNGFFHIVYEDQISKQVWYRKASFEPITNLEKDNILKTDFKIFPNPVQDVLNIVSENSMIRKVELSDANGRIIIETSKHSSPLQLNLKDLKSGIYFLKIFTNDPVFIREIMH